MTASRKCVALAGVVLALIGLLCLGTVVASAAFSIGDIREFVSRGPSLALGAGLGIALTALGGAMIGWGPLRRAFRRLRRDPALVVLNHSPWSVIEEFHAVDAKGNGYSGLPRRTEERERSDRFGASYSTLHESRSEVHPVGR
ncbi:MAG: hypothetical protein JNK85_27285 [Verrucomicrobiales bacterium]|nr:hypothetical protein [Verrucomicrobiales bacterium]